MEYAKIIQNDVTAIVPTRDTFLNHIAYPILVSPYEYDLNELTQSSTDPDTYSGTITINEDNDADGLFTKLADFKKN